MKKTRIYLWISIILIGAYLVYRFVPQFWGSAVYPLKYETMVKKYALEYGFSPNFIAAVIYKESTFNANATSPVGARGLMQVMPTTGDWIATQVGEENYTRDKLYNPETSIKFGCFYLRDLANRFDGNIQLALLSYNAGAGTANRLIKINPSDPLSAASKGVNSYVTKILEVEKMYDKVYGKWYASEEMQPYKIGKIEPEKIDRPWYTLPGTWFGEFFLKYGSSSADYGSK